VPADVTATFAVVRSFPAHPSALYHMRKFVREQAAEAGVPEEATAELVLAVSEACANAVLHTSSPEVKLSWRVLGDRVEVLVQDTGIFERRVRMPELEGGGHGVPLMMALVDEVTIKEGTPSRPGTLVRLVKSRTGRS
jgi:anti-sigma regulatory factor (Ser/Thr protein kinase)